MPKPTQDQLDMVLAHNSQIGLLCTQWVYLEWMLEVAIWWFSDLLDKSDEERLTETGGKPISVLAREAGNIAHRKLTSKHDLDAMKDIPKRIEESLTERNLAIHGVRTLSTEDVVLARVTRGRNRGTLQNLSLIRLRSLNEEVAQNRRCDGIVAVLKWRDRRYD